MEIDPQQIAELVAHAPFGAVLNMPTGAGKTWIATEAIKAVLGQGFRAIYVTPLRALAEELSQRWRAEIADQAIGVFTGDYGNGKQYPVPFQEARLLVMTPERLDACTRAWRSHWKWIPQVDLIVVDEIHLLSDSGRGPRLEGALSRFRRLNPFVRIAGLSATMGNPYQLADWLDAGTFRTTKRPIPLDWKIVRYRKATDKPDLLYGEIQRIVAQGGSSLVFVQSRRRAEQLANLLRERGISTGHHHAGLNRAERAQVESSFRNKETQALVATSTLEMGLNLPVRQVVLYDLQSFDGSEFKALSTNSVWQRVGRAGRRGLDVAGEAVLLAAAWDRNSAGYELGRFENIESRMDQSSALAEQIVTEVASGMARTRSQLKDALALSLAAKQNRLRNVDSVIDLMVDAKMLVETVDEDEPQCRLRLKATRLGRIAVRHMISPETVIRINRICESQTEQSIFDLLVVLATSTECEPILAVDFEELEHLAAEINAHPTETLAGQQSQELCERLSVSPRRMLAALKMACVLREWTRVGKTDAVADKFDCYPFEVARLVDSASRLCLALHQIATSKHDDGSEEEAKQLSEEVSIDERLYAIQKMVAHGIDELVVTLTLVPGLGGVLAKRLAENGIGDIEELALCEQSDLAKVRGVSPTRATKWIEAAESLVKQRHAYAFRESIVRKTNCVVSSRPSFDPYRLRRAMELRIEGRLGDGFRVVGGLEPHRVLLRGTKWHCDCADRAKGNLCKHILAVRLMQKDSELIRFVDEFKNDKSENTIDLFELWFASDTPRKRKLNA